MIIYLHKNFSKKYTRLTKSQKEKFKIHRNLFMADEFDPILNNHALSGRYEGYRSINVTGDIRAIYKKISAEKVIFVTIGNHSNLYR